MKITHVSPAAQALLDARARTQDAPARVDPACPTCEAVRTTLRDVAIGLRLFWEGVR